YKVTGVQTCALPISRRHGPVGVPGQAAPRPPRAEGVRRRGGADGGGGGAGGGQDRLPGGGQGSGADRRARQGGGCQAGRRRGRRSEERRVGKERREG